MAKNAIVKNLSISFATAGKYAIAAKVAFPANSSGEREVTITVNKGSGEFTIDYGYDYTPDINFPSRPSIYTEYNFEAGDTLKIKAYQTSGCLYL